MKRNHMTLVATAVAVSLFLLTLGASRASADSFNFTSCHFSSGCPAAGTVFGTVTLTQSGTSVNFVVTLSAGNRFVETGAGGNEFFLFNDKLSGSSVINAVVSIGMTPAGGLTGFTNISPAVHADGTGHWTGSVECLTSSSCNGGSTPTVNEIKFTVTNATVAGLETMNDLGNVFVADILCSSCSGSPTGDIDANTKTPTVPDGGMTLILLGGALVGVETLRRKFRV